jgi:FkbM family methyltransferase
MSFLSLSSLTRLTRLLPTGLVVPIVAGPLKGKKWIVGAAAGEGKGMSIVINQSEPIQVGHAVAMLDDSKVCFDFGANVGFYTLLFSLFSKQVYAFEPLPRNLRYLIRMLEINKVTNAKIIPCAVSSSSKIDYFSEGDNQALGRLDKRGDIPVLVTTCDQFVSDTNIVPDLLKIDVEGAELELLQGARAVLETSHPSILLSVHSDGLRTDCLSFLREIGYQAFIPLDSGDELEATEFAIHHTNDRNII